MKILEVCTALDGGGVDRYLLNYCSRLNDIEFDFVVVSEKKGILEPLLEQKGARIYHIPRISKGILKNYNALKLIMKENNYDAIHSHLGHKSIIALLCARHCGIKTRITHSHQAYPPESIFRKMIRKFLTYFVILYSSSLAACGFDAAVWLWGRKRVENNLVSIQNNAIEIDKYSFNNEIRTKIRNDLNLVDKIVVGHVGRLSFQKNQLRLLDIFKIIHSKNPQTFLFLIGEDELNGQIEEKINILDLKESVIVFGVRSDANLLLNAMDVFLFPSIFEGLPFTLIETQCNGLMAISSDVVTSHVKVTDCVFFESLASNDEQWADKTLELAKQGRNHETAERIKDAGYDILYEASKLKNYYISEIRRWS